MPFIDVREEFVPVQSSEMNLESVGTELDKLRRIAEQADNAVLLYIIDMAIRETKTNRGSSGAIGEGSAGTERKPTPMSLRRRRYL